MKDKLLEIVCLGYIEPYPSFKIHKLNVTNIGIEVA